MIARIRRVRRGEAEGGFALIFALLVTTLVVVGVGASLAVVAPNVINARKTQDDLAALTAAQSGVDDVIAYLSSVPSCRSQTIICPQALNASSTKLAGTTRQRPGLGTDQSVSWSTGSAVTADGYVRVTSTGKAGRSTRTLVADLSLQPSILAYGYYTDYESFSPQYLNDYYNPRNIYLSNATTYGVVTSANRNGASAPQTVTWNGAAAGGTSARCGQHWYYESVSSPGRASYATPAGNVNAQTYWDETGTNNSTSSGSKKSVSRTGQCDLVFTSAMVEDGLTYSRDAIFSSGAGPTFNKPVYTMWGYTDGAKNYNNPAFNPAGQYYRGSAMTSGTPYKPAVAAADLVLPRTIGTDALSDDSCVYTGPTRVRLNGNGTATVTSPTTRTRDADADPKCYPNGDISSSGVQGWVVDYGTVGSGTMIARNLGSAPSGGWPANPTKSTQTAGATNEVFYLPPSASQDVVRHTDSSTASTSGCTGSGYSATVGATCAWTNLNSATNVGTGTGWSSYSNSTCSTAAGATGDRQLFECEYGAQLASARPTVNQTGGQYKLVRDAIQADLAGGSCLTGSTATQVSCVNSIVTSRVSPANTASTPVRSGDHRYTASSVAGTPVTSLVARGSVTGPVGDDPLFVQPTPASESVTQTPITTTVTRQRYNGSAWVAAGNAFTVTTTQADYTYTAAQGATYFPRTDDVTEYNTGVDANGNTVGSTGSRQPGDLYLEGNNKGKLSLVADNDVVITGNVQNPANSTGATDAMSIVAGRNVRNYHPVSCDDQNATDINNTTAGWCPNDITGLTSGSTGLFDSNGNFTAAHPTQQYDNLQATGDRTVDAAIFALSGSLRTDNYDRANWVGNLTVNGGIYQSARGGNGVVYNGSNNTRSGTTLQYTYVDLQRAELPYAPPATSGNYTRPWNVVSVSAGKNP